MKAYLINLDRSPERLAHFGAQAARAGLPEGRVAEAFMIVSIP